MYDRGDLDGALDHYKRALDIDEQLGDLQLQGQVLTNIGFIMRAREDLDGALDHFKRALDIAEQLGDLKGKGQNLTSIGLIMRDRGDLDGALDYYRRALDIDEQLGDLKGKGQNLTNIGLIMRDQGDLDGALDHYNQTLNLIQKRIKGQELDFKSGQIKCPRQDCIGEIQIKLTGIQGAITKTCPECKSQLYVWINANSVYQIGGLSEGNLFGEIELRSQKGRETETEVPEWLQLSAITAQNMAYCYNKKSDFLNACNYYFQAASMYGGLGFLEVSKKNLKYLENLLPNISIEDRERFSHDMARFRQRSSESLRSRDFTYIFVSCPNCHKDHQIRASTTTIADELCSNCRAKFSVFYNDETQEYYTTILEKPKIRTFSQPEKIKRDMIQFCARCGLNVGTIVTFCPKCGLNILRDSLNINVKIKEMEKKKK
jgi:tetratricopeptide (TPR) repeat protein